MSKQEDNSKWYDEDLVNKRINIIGQNGNDGEHYSNETIDVTRLEVIQHSEPYNGRAYTNYNVKDLQIQFQDNGKTLKIFLK